MLKIRYGTMADADLIADFSRRTFYETFSTHNTKEDIDKFMSEQFSREMLMSEVGAEGNIFLLAFNGSSIIGYARMRVNNKPPELGDANAVEISRIYASTNAIGKGVGKALMERCISIARASGKEVIWLGVWDKNQRAIDFYIKWGFEKFGEHPFVLGNDVQSDWMMKKILD